MSQRSQRMSGIVMHAAPARRNSSAGLNAFAIAKTVGEIRPDGN